MCWASLQLHLAVAASDDHPTHTIIPLYWCNILKGRSPSCILQDYLKLLSISHAIWK